MNTAQMQNFQLTRNAFGQLALTTADGIVHTGVIPVRAFALTAPTEGISLVSTNGQELVWIHRLAELPAIERAIIEEELAQREFMPTIECITSVSSFATPSEWSIVTNKGPATLVLKGEEDIRRLNLYGQGIQSLIIADSHGIQYFVPNRAELDRHSKKLLDRFL
ncbi:MAG: hypothetical protein RIR18_49 [Pseudomonadota bacterium]